MIFRNTEKDKDLKLFFTSSANWEAVVTAGNPTEAATKAVEFVFEQDRDMKISPTIMSLDLSSEETQEGNLSNFEFIYAPQALSDAGLHKVSKTLTDVIENAKQ